MEVSIPFVLLLYTYRLQDSVRALPELSNGGFELDIRPFFFYKTTPI